MFEIRDHCDGTTRHAEDRDGLAEELEEMFDAGEDGVAEAIAAIAEGILREYTGDWEEFLNIAVSPCHGEGD